MPTDYEDEINADITLEEEPIPTDVPLYASPLMDATGNTDVIQVALAQDAQDAPEDASTPTIDATVEAPDSPTETIPVPPNVNPQPAPTSPAEGQPEGEDDGEEPTFGDYAITEAGFGADLGAEKFFNIKCRKSGLCPKLTIIVATLQGLKMHGDVPLEKIKEPDAEGVRKGFANLDRHIRNMKSFGQTVMVCFNKFASDTEEEIRMVEEHCRENGVYFAVNDAYARGGEGAVDLAGKVADIIEKDPSGPLVFTYPDETDTAGKITAVAKNIYGAGSVTFSPASRRQMARIEQLGLSGLPVCIAKTQYSFSQDPKRYGAPSGFNFEIKDIIINTGAEMIVAIAGDIIRMPGLPKEPQALHIDIVDGQIEGLS